MRSKVDDADRIVGICSGGGHLAELLAILQFMPEVDLVITETRTVERNKIQGIKLIPLIDPHRSIGQYFLNIISSVFLWVKLRPRVVISTGAGMTVPFFVICRLLGARCIWIESGARVVSPAKSSKFCYRFAHLFISQSTELEQFFPNAVVRSIIPDGAV